jgi:hypothetical protein
MQISGIETGSTAGEGADWRKGSGRRHKFNSDPMDQSAEVLIELADAGFGRVIRKV